MVNQERGDFPSFFVFSRNLSFSQHTINRPVKKGVTLMGVENTSAWLKESINDPIKICEKICKIERKENPENLYNYLTQFGMYRPNSRHQEIFEALEKRRIWDMVKKLFQKYKKKWNGPDIPVYIFPIGSGSGLFQSPQTKSGVSFPDKLFLFLSDIEDELEIEALFIHEYHHICRLHGLKKSINEYTLLDSLIMEGLAEDAVHEILGSKYVAKWNKMLSNENFKLYMEKYLQDNLTLKKGTRKHDQLLFGKGLLPNMLGYTCGYHIVRSFRLKNSYSTRESFMLESEIFINFDNDQA
jgi:uncharacterized protein YjaZ